jgi:hypothetical protein
MKSAAMSTPLRERPDAPLGTLIFRAGLLPAETIESALQESSRTGKRLGEILLERNLLQETQLSRLLAGQKGLPFVTLRERGVDVDAAKLFSEDQARLYRALPFQVDSGTPVVAISDPTNDVVMRNIREALDGMDVQFAVATKSELTELMSEIYHPNGNGNGSAENGASPVATVDPEPVSAGNAPPVDAVEEETPASEPEAAMERVPDPEPEIAPEPEPDMPALPEPAPIQEAAMSDPEPVEQPSLHEPEPEPQAPPEHALIEPAPFQVAPAPMPEPAPLRVARPLESAPAHEPESPVGSATVRVVIRLSNNDRVDAAVVGDPRAAKAQAQALIRYIAGKDGSDWPYVGGRFLKPDAIVSVDLVEQIPGETGSAG